jgi:uncharacterized protein YecE (DUF72 family)
MAPDAAAVATAPVPGIRVGCSGWQYKHWRQRFYPADLPVSKWLPYYAARFDTVEINNSFYRLPDEAVFADWRSRVPRGFVYAVKASRFLTHMKKLKDPQAPVDLLFSRASHLRSALGPVLYQLPPRWPLNLSRLVEFVEALPRRRKHVIEFRDPSWYVDEVFETLQRHRVAMCLHDMAGSAPEPRQIGPFIYLRFHGPARYRGRYEDAHLTRWADWCGGALSQGLAVYAYFNNDIDADAPRDAERFRVLLEGVRQTAATGQ